MNLFTHFQEHFLVGYFKNHVIYESRNSNPSLDKIKIVETKGPFSKPLLENFLVDEHINQFFLLFSSIFSTPNINHMTSYMFKPIHVF